MNGTPGLTYLGLSSFELVTPSTTVLVDPWLSEPEWSPWTPADFAHVDYVFVTHGAYDHLGDALPVAEHAGATVVTEPAVAAHLRDEGLPADRVRKVIWGNRFDLPGGVEVRVVETRHLSYFQSAGGERSGMPLGFHFELDGTSVYYVGDTSLFSDLELFVERDDPDVVLLPVGGAPGDLAPLPPEDAALASSWFGDRVVVPVHYVPGSDEPAAYRRALDDRRDGLAESPTVRTLEPGDTLELPP